MEVLGPVPPTQFLQTPGRLCLAALLTFFLAAAILIFAGSNDLSELMVEVLMIFYLGLPGVALVLGVVEILKAPHRGRVTFLPATLALLVAGVFYAYLVLNW